MGTPPFNGGKMETRTERASLTLTPTERDAVDLLAHTYGWTRSEVLREYSVDEIVRLAAVVQERANARGAS